MTSEDNIDQFSPYFDGTCEVTSGDAASNQNSCNSGILKTDDCIDPYENKNRHNKNVVIWKDDYLLPLHHASIQMLEDLHIDQIFQSPPKQFAFDRGKDISFLDNDDDTNCVKECHSCNYIAKSKSEPLYNGKHYTEQEYSPVGLLSSFSEDIGSRLTESFRCSRYGCECPFQHSPYAECKKVESACEFHRHSRPFCTHESNIFNSESKYESIATENCVRTASAPLPENGNNAASNDGEYSERSSYSTDPGDAENGYEIVDWDSEWELGDCSNFVEEQTHTINKDECKKYTSTKSGNFSDDGASSRSLHAGTQSYCMIENSEGAYSLDPQSNGLFSETYDIVAGTQQMERECSSSDKTQGRSNNAVQSTIGSTEQIQPKNAQDTTCEDAPKVLNQKGNNNFIRRRQRRRQSTYTAENPTLIDAQSIQYEADPKTGKVLTVGKGSFGQVFKARFYDSRFRHLRIVVKEFDENFTSKHETVEEAQKLLYLRDTGYVPVCYGLVNLGAQFEPRYGIVQEYIGSGLTLEQMLWDQYDLPMEMWLSVALQCCEGLGRFHNKGILLNDIKSNNIILEFSQESVNIRYIDFGLATDMRGKRYKNTKSLEDFVYLAPEVRIHGQVTTVATDVYSLGYMLEQINGCACIPELRFVAGLCMKTVPTERTLVSVAASFIGNYMNRLGCDTQFSKGFDFMFSTGFW